MEEKYVTLGTPSMKTRSTLDSEYVQVDGGPRVKISIGDFQHLWHMAEVLARGPLELQPVPGTDGGEEQIRFPLRYPIHEYLPKACSAVQTPEGPQTIPGQLGALTMTVGGAEALATMLGVATTDILAWARDGVPDGPAKILLVRLGEDFGLNLSRISVKKRVESMSGEAV